MLEEASKVLLTTALVFAIFMSGYMLIDLQKRAVENRKQMEIIKWKQHCSDLGIPFNECEDRLKD